MCSYANHKNRYIQRSVYDYGRMETFVMCIIILFNKRRVCRLPEMAHVRFICNVIKILKYGLIYSGSQLQVYGSDVQRKTFNALFILKAGVYP
jgi:hypothetical protein